MEFYVGQRKRRGGREKRERREKEGGKIQNGPNINFPTLLYLLSHSLQSTVSLEW
jgi:hypothetical protein